MIVREKHEKIIKDFMCGLNKESKDFVIKGGTALFLCYNLDRFSTDIDLDSQFKISNYVERFCKKNDYIFNLKKDTDTVQRYTIHYDKNEDDTMLKIEVSHRKYDANRFKYNVINDILTYDINSIFSMKLAAGLNRSKIRDLYDICFIYNNYKNEISDANLLMLDVFLNEKGDNYFEYLIKDQGNDEVIDIEKFEDMYLKMLYDLDRTKGKNINYCKIESSKTIREKYKDIVSKDNIDKNEYQNVKGKKVEKENDGR